MYKAGVYIQVLAGQLLVTKTPSRLPSDEHLDSVGMEHNQCAGVGFVVILLAGWIMMYLHMPFIH